MTERPVEQPFAGSRGESASAGGTPLPDGVGPAEYVISTDPARLDLDAVERMLRKTYWAEIRPRAVIEKSIAGSLSFGVYHQGEQVGFARAVTDYATFVWICDVVIDERHRAAGVGGRLVNAIVTHEAIHNIRQLLATRDAHSFYERFGFERISENFLGREFVLIPGRNDETPPPAAM